MKSWKMIGVFLSTNKNENSFIFNALRGFWA